MSTPQGAIVVGADTSPDSRRALAWAALHGWRGNRVNWGGTSARSRAAPRREAARQLLDGALAGWAAKYPDLTILRQVLPIPPARLLADAAEHAALLRWSRPSARRGWFATRHLR